MLREPASHSAAPQGFAGAPEAHRPLHGDLQAAGILLAVRCPALPESPVWTIHAQ